MGTPSSSAAEGAKQAHYLAADCIKTRPCLLPEPWKDTHGHLKSSNTESKTEVNLSYSSNALLQVL